MELPGVYMELKDVKDMYETYTVGDISDPGVDYSPSTWPDSAAEQKTGQDLPNPESDEEKDYVMFVHGWNMARWEKEKKLPDAFAEVILNAINYACGTNGVFVARPVNLSPPIVPPKIQLGPQKP